MVVKYGGVDLASLGLHIQAIDGLYGGPSPRGANVLLPYQPGRLHTTKYYDERHIVLSGVLAGNATRQALETRLDTLVALFPIGSGEQRLEVTRADGTARDIKAEPVSIMTPADSKNARGGKFSIEFVASDPFWYATLFEGLAWALDSGIYLDDGIHYLDQGIWSIAVSPTFIDAPNDGNTTNRKPIFTLVGQTANPTILNTRNGYSVQVNLVAGNPVNQLVIDCGARTVTLNGVIQSPSVVVLGANQTDWMHIEPGANSLQITGGAGVATIQPFYHAAYL